jgi:hypothetical protein
MLNSRWWSAAGFLFAGAMLALLAQSVPHDAIKPAHAQPLLPGPNVYAYTAVTTAQIIIGANPTRHALQICNPGGTNVLWIAPTSAAAIGGQTGAITTVIVPSANGAGTVGVPVTASGVVPCFSPPTSAPSIGAQWSAFSTTTPVTVYEWP